MYQKCLMCALTFNSEVIWLTDAADHSPKIDLIMVICSHCGDDEQLVKNLVQGQSGYWLLMVDM